MKSFHQQVACNAPFLLFAKPASDSACTWRFILLAYHIPLFLFGLPGLVACRVGNIVSVAKFGRELAMYLNLILAESVGIPVFLEICVARSRRECHMSDQLLTDLDV